MTLAFALAALGVAAPAHAAMCDAEVQIRADPRWRPSEFDHRVINRVELGPGTQLRWNGASVSLARIRTYVALGGSFNPEPATVLYIGPEADCDLIPQVRRTIEEATACTERYCLYGLIDTPPRPRRRR